MDKKLNATFQVVDKMDRKALSEKHEGVIHLFEQTYEDMFFWYGVAESEIPGRAFSTRHPREHWYIAVNVLLEDGRAGQCHLLTMHAEGGNRPSYQRLQLLGTSELKPLDPRDPHFSPLF